MYERLSILWFLKFTLKQQNVENKINETEALFEGANNAKTSPLLFVSEVDRSS